MMPETAKILMDCPEPGCDGILVRISLPSETIPSGKLRCITCGLITWFLPEVQGHTGKPMHMMTIRIFQDSTEDITGEAEG